MFSVIGLIVLAIQNKMGGRVHLLIFCLASYIFGSWWAWWFGGAFGTRSFVEFYAVLALPLAYMLKYLVDWIRAKRLIGYAGLALLILFMYFNIKLTYQYNPPWDGPEWGTGPYLKEVGKLFSF